MPRKRTTSLLLILCLTAPAAQAESDTFTTTHFSGSGNCALCHDNLTDTGGADVSIVRDWGAGMMANSAKDPFWKAKVATELARNPHLSAVINDKCSACHAPMANYEITQVRGDEIEVLGPDGVLDPAHPLHDAALNGVSCTLCHQILDDTGLGTLSGFSGQYRINDSKLIYGPFSDIFGQPMINNTGYTPLYGPHVSDSAVCATCHNLKTPYVDATGNVVTHTPEAEFPEQMPYTEWEHSVFADGGSNPRSCQDCHMPKTTARVSNRPRWLTAKEGFGKHHLVGANTVVLSLLRDNAGQLDVISQDLDLGIERARAMLQSAVTLDILSAAVVDQPDGQRFLEVRVRLTNESGHKAPTAYPSRRMWLHFRVTDSSGNLLFESGRMNADGSIVGADNDLDQTDYEPHYDLITAADQVQIYETVMGDTDGLITYTLLRAAQYLKDNRLTPQGFDKFDVPTDVAVSGDAFEDENFNLGSDEVTYRIPVSVGGELTVEVSLNYQPLAHGFVQDLYAENQLPEVQTFRALYEPRYLKHEVVSSVQTTVVSAGSSPPAVSLTAVPDTIDLGQTTVLSWNATDATECVASGAWSGGRSTSGSETLSPKETSLYTITCNGDGGSASAGAAVTVNPPAAPEPSVSLTANPSSVPRGGSITLGWSSTDTESCLASGDWSGEKAPSGSETVTITDPVTFNLTCSGTGGSATGSLSYQARGRRWLEQR